MRVWSTPNRRSLSRNHEPSRTTVVFGLRLNRDVGGRLAAPAKTRPGCGPREGSARQISGPEFGALEKLRGGLLVSIVRVGLAETKHFAEGYDAIFGKKKQTQ